MISKGVLYIVATPIGNLADISARALTVLQQVDLIAAEDTRHSQKLLQHYGIQTPLISYHDHNEKARYQVLLARLQAGESIALISDAGTPLISDPGYQLVRNAHQANIPVIPIPGACAAIAALSAAGLPTDKFIFEGFLSAKAIQRRQRLQTFVSEERTVILYESTHRILALISDMLAIFGHEREIVLAKELTKTFEKVLAGTISEIEHWLQQDERHQNGEFAILLHGAPAVSHSLTDTVQPILQALLSELPTKQAVNLARKITGASKNALYELALKLANTP